MNYEIYENNGGALLLAIVNGDVCERIYENWEYGPAGNMLDALHQLRTDPQSHELWDGDLAERLSMEQDREISADEIYHDSLGLGDLIAEMDDRGVLTVYPQRAGCAGEMALNLTDAETHWDQLIKERF